MTRTKISDWLEALAAGQMSVEEVAARLRDGALDPGAARPATLQEAMADSGPGYEPGTFDEVSRALHLGTITLDQYSVLAAAAGGAARRQQDA